MKQFKKKYSKFLAMLMVFIMVLVMMPMQAFAATSFTHAIKDAATVLNAGQDVKANGETTARKHFTVIAPKGSVVSAGTLSTYYIYSFKEPISTKNEDDNVIYEFEPLSGSAFVRVQRPDDEDAVTYWNWASSKADGQTITVTEDMLFKNDDNSFDSDTVYHNFENGNNVDVADIYLNANEKGYINLETDGTFTFNVFRNWQAIESWSNAKTCLPDVKYMVIDEKGSKSSVVTVTPDENNSSVATLKANSQGTAIVLVTYDAVYSDSHMAGDGKFSAIWPENTGVLVVTVGADGSSINTNMTINEGKNENPAISKLIGDSLDAEHDVLYYTEKAGASYSFTPEDGCKVSVARAELTNKSLTYSGFTTDKVDVNSKTGEVTVSGLTAGSHIIKVEKDGKATYQVIRAKQTTTAITDSEGTAVTSETRVKPGTQLTLQFGDLYNPINKLAGIYNTNCRIYYKGEDGTEFRGGNGGNYGYYTFASDTHLHNVTVTVPSDWDKDTYTVSGCLQTGGFGDGAGRHRGATYATGKPVNTTANSTAAYLGELPEITVNIDIPATAVSLDKRELDLNCKDSAQLKATTTPENATDTKTWTSSDNKVATVDKNGKVTAVGAGEATITLTAGEFSDTCKVTVKHAFTENVDEKYLKKKATCTEKAVYYKSCACGAVGTETFQYGALLPSVAKAKVSKISAKTYTGKALKQSPVVKVNNKTLKAGTDYTLSYKNNKKVGTATVVITGKGSYGGTLKKTFAINPKGATISKPKAAKKAITVKWKKQSTKMTSSRITGYKVQCSTSKTFKKNVKSATVKGYSKVSKKMTKLKAKKTYYVRVKTYMKVGSKTYYSSWSTVKKVKTK